MDRRKFIRTLTAAGGSAVLLP
ncbi:MAG: hypothetical protein JWM12_1790, partial [Ilumatobacteraceae bacterium]|nr:hypothetical protein [Ilumatobacteraceae bacterium]